MKRKVLMAALRVAGYHEDQKSFMRLYCENIISRDRAQEQYSIGQRQKLAGIKCTCRDCNLSSEFNQLPIKPG